MGYCRINLNVATYSFSSTCYICQCLTMHEASYLVMMMKHVKSSYTMDRKGVFLPLIFYMKKWVGGSSLSLK